MTSEAMTCAQVEERLAGYLADGLSSADEDRLARHLTSCPACAAEVAVAERVELELSALPAFDAPPELIARIKAVAESGSVAVAPVELAVEPAIATKAEQSRPIHARPRLALAAGLLLALALGWWGLDRRKLDRWGIDNAGPSTAEIAAAEQEARYALALVARLSRRAGVEIRDEVLVERIAKPVLRGVTRPLDGTAVAKAGGSSS